MSVRGTTSGLADFGTHRLVDPVSDDLPQPWAPREWWYLHSHLTGHDGRQYAAHVAFVRHAVGEGDEPVAEMPRMHQVMWGIVDLEEGRYHGYTAIDALWPDVIGDALRHDQLIDPKIRDALLRALDGGGPLLPDRLLSGEVTIAADRLAIQYGDEASLERTQEGLYQLTALSPDGATSLDLTFIPTKPPVWQGTDGQVDVGAPEERESMFYYSISRGTVTGCVTIDSARHDVAQGSGWYDHQFGASPQPRTRGLRAAEVAWTWIGLQLDNGWDLCGYESEVMGADTRVADRSSHPGILVPPQGDRTLLPDLEFTVLENWTSMQTLHTYPSCLQVTSPSHAIELTVTSVLANQELRTMANGRGYWEGRVSVSGTMQGEQVTGVGFLEVLPLNVINDVETYLGGAGEEARRQIRQLYPDTLNPAAAADLIGPDGDRYLSGIDCDQMTVGLVQPVRHLVDAAAKFWRPYALMAALELAGADCEPYRPLMAAAELLHVGSLIVDDVEDQSPTRRGRPAAHVVFGQDVAINAGTAAYFSFDRAMAGLSLDVEHRQRLYQLFCGALRAAHVGQAVDIAGHRQALEAAIESGQGARIRERVLATHRLKTAVPVRRLAEVGAVLADAPEPLFAALGDYFEALGLAYQIADDIIDMRGTVDFERDSQPVPPLRAVGTDIRNAKVSYPIARAVDLLPAGEMNTLWKRVRAAGADPAEVAVCIATLEEHGVLDRCISDAEALVEGAWQKLEPLVDRSMTAAMVHALGWFAVYRDCMRKG